MGRTTRVLSEDLYFGECPRWHKGRLWFSDFFAHGVKAVSPAGDLNVGPVELGVTVKQLDIWKSGQLADFSLSLGAKSLFISVLNTFDHARHHLEVSK
jgi:hypothetical protein